MAFLSACDHKVAKLENQLKHKENNLAEMEQKIEGHYFELIQLKKDNTEALGLRAQEQLRTYYE